MVSFLSISAYADSENACTDGVISKASFNDSKKSVEENSYIGKCGLSWDLFKVGYYSSKSNSSSDKTRGSLKLGDAGSKIVLDNIPSSESERVMSFWLRGTYLKPSSNSELIIIQKNDNNASCSNIVTFLNQDNGKISKSDKYYHIKLCAHTDELEIIYLKEYGNLAFDDFKIITTDQAVQGGNEDDNATCEMNTPDHIDKDMSPDVGNSNTGKYIKFTNIYDDNYKSKVPIMNNINTPLIFDGVEGGLIGSTKSLGSEKKSTDKSDNKRYSVKALTVAGGKIKTTSTKDTHKTSTAKPIVSSVAKTGRKPAVKAASVDKIANYKLPGKIKQPLYDRKISASQWIVAGVISLVVLGFVVKYRYKRK